MTKTIPFQPKYITFDCYGTLTNFSRMSLMVPEIYGSRLQGPDLQHFTSLFSGYRYDECLGPYKPYREVLINAIHRTCLRTSIPFSESEAEKFYDAVPTWGPHPDVTEGLKRLAKKYKLVMLSNAADDQIMSNVSKLGVEFHAVFTAQQTGAYKPAMKGFEHMFEKLGCKPEDCLHVSGSFLYDLHTAEHLGMGGKVWVNRSGKRDGLGLGIECFEVGGIGELANMLGL